MAFKPGERHERAKLNEDGVRDIRRRYAAGGVTILDLANDFDVCYSTARSVIARRTWRNTK